MYRTIGTLILASLAQFLVAGEAHAFDPFIYSPDLNLSDEDGRLVTIAARKLYIRVRAKVGDRETWSNPNSGNSGAVTLLTLYSRNGAPCRRIHYHFVTKLRPDWHSVQFDHCRTMTGEWEIR